MFIVQVHDNGILRELVHIGCERVAAVTRFLEACGANLSNWDEYTSADRDDVLDQGYVETGNGVVVEFIDTDGFTSDDAIRDQLTKQPAGDMKVAQIIESGEVALTEGMTVDEMLELCGNNLDAANSWDIQGQVLFKGTDGKWYTVTTESVVSEAKPIVEQSDV